MQTVWRNVIPAIFLFVLGAAISIQAQTSVPIPTPADDAAAHALFDKGWALLRDGKAEEALTEFREADKLRPNH